ncbi:phage holin family protein [Bacillus methanolicus]|nr:phage holin family protein [Bacillus methanolicus]
MERFDIIYKTVAAAVGAVVGFLFGDQSIFLRTLLSFSIIDYGTGTMAAYVEGRLQSAIGFKRIPKKVVIFALVAAAHLVDRAIGTNNLFRDATIFFYLANELLSIIENAGRIGLPVPEQIRQAVEVLRGKNEEKIKNNVRLFNEIMAYIPNTCNNTYRFNIIKLYIKEDRAVMAKIRNEKLNKSVFGGHETVSVLVVQAPQRLRREGQN